MTASSNEAASRLQALALAHAEDIIATLREPFLVLDESLRVCTANAAFYRDFRVSQDETEGRLIYDLGDGQWNIPQLRTLLGQVQSEVHSVEDFAVEHTFPEIGCRIMLLNARRLPVESGSPGVILLAIEDHTDRKRAGAALRISEVRYRRLFETAKDGILILAADTGRVIDSNPFMSTLLGYSHAEFLGKELWQIGLFRDIQESQAAFRELQEKGYVRYENLPLQSTDGRHVEVEFVSNIYAEGDRQVVQCNVRDITARRCLERQMQELALAMRLTEDRFRLFIEGVKDYAIYTMDPAGKILTWNDGAARIFGHSSREIIGQNRRVLFTPAQVAEGVPDRELKLAAAQGKAAEECWRIRKDGARFWANGTLSAFHDAAGVLQGFVKVVRDLTGRRRAETLLQSVLNGTFDGIVSSDHRGIVQSFNQAAERTFGYQSAEVVGKNISMLMPEPFHSEHDGYIARYQRTGEAKIIGIGRETVGLRKDGSTFPIELAVTEFRLEEHDEPLFIGMIRDITHRMQIEENQARLVSILEATPDFVGIADTEGRPLFINQSGRRMIGIGFEEDVSKIRIADYFAESVTNTLANEAIPFAIKHGTWRGETVLRAKDGHEFPASQLIIVPKTDRGEARFLSMIMRDLTERKNLEEQFRQAQKMEAVGQLAGGVAHDFNNLLTVILGYSAMLLSKMEATNPDREFVTSINEAGERATSLTRQLLAFSRHSVLSPKVLRPSEVVREMEKLLRRLIGEDICLVSVLDPATSKVKIDPDQLGQVLMNLAVNARDSMPKGGNLTIESRNIELDQAYARLHIKAKPGHYALITLTDSGCGMTPEVKARIFEPFFTTKGIGKGTGLGLAVVHGIIEQSGGFVEVYSEAGIGTSFKLYLPAVDEGESASKELDSASVPHGTETVLVCEDEASLRGLAQLILQSCGYTVLTASDGNEAIQVVEDHQGHVDLLFTDVVMPGMGGFDLAQALQRKLPHLKVLFSSGYTGDAVLRHGLAQETVAFLPKPYAPLTLARKVRQVLDESR